MLRSLRSGAGVALLLLAASGAGCLSVGQDFKCTTDAQCALAGAAGTCELTGFCSFPDVSCASARRYHESAGSVGNQCVENCGGPEQACCTMGPQCRTNTMTCGGGLCQRCIGSISAAGMRTCVLRTTDSKVLCWGENTDGQVGSGNLDPVTNPTVVVTSSGEELSDVAEVKAGDHHTCALKTDGTVWCWGSNSDGQLGDGTTTTSGAAVQVKGLSDATTIACGADHSCARSGAGIIWCWGKNADGQLGDGTTNSQSHPVAVRDPSTDGGTPLSGDMVGGGEGHTCVISGDTMWCWGSNKYGQLGNGEKVNDPVMAAAEVTPPATINWSGLAGLSLGEGHTCVRRNNAFVYCWGENEFGQLGDIGGQPYRLVPNAVSSGTDNQLFAGTVEIYAGEDNECALKGDGSMWCWGNNGNGQLGDGTDSNLRSLPVRVMANESVPLSSVVQGAAGEVHGCALRLDGSVWCWGLNQPGVYQLGQTTPASSNYPIRVPLSCQ